MDGRIHVLICDDNPAILDELAEIVRGSMDSLVITAVTDLNQLGTKWQAFQIAVMDIKLSKSSRIDAAREILSANPECQIIFVSGYLDYVTDVYDVPHLCLILKDRSSELLPKYIGRAVELLRQERAAALSVTSRGKTIMVEPTGICYVERHGHVSYIHCLHQTDYEVPDKLSCLMAKLNGNLFCRCHISYIINFSHVASYQRTQFTMCNGAIIPISRINSGTTREQYMTFIKAKLG